ncbi:hypothetical protein M8J77_023454 [Diaphorina citri]|nr:hypothetical protein M8J77_023454 [Diaphorina citri]
MDHVQQWIQDDTSGRIHGDDDDVAKKRLKTDGSEIDNSEDYEEFFLRRTGGIILRSEMKSCTKGPQSEGTGGGVKKKNLAAEIGLESEEEEEEGGKENIFGRKNVPAVLKPNDNKVLVVNSQGVVALDPVEIPNLSSGIYIMTNKNEENKTSGPGNADKPPPEKKPLGEAGGFVVLDENERSVKFTNNEMLGYMSVRPVETVSHATTNVTLPPKIPQLTSFKSGALTITPSVRNISKDPSANFTKRHTPNSQPQTPQTPSLQKILGPKNTKGYTDFTSTPKSRQQPQVIYTSRQQPQITYLNSSGETTNKRVLGSVNRYKATPDKPQINHSEIHYTPSQATKTIIKQEAPPNLMIPTSGYQIENSGVTDTVMIKVEMSPGGTSQYVRGLSGLDSPQYASVNAALQNQGQVSGLKVKRITSPRKRNSSVRDSAHISILNRKDVAGGGGNALAVPARKLKMFRNEEEEVEEAAPVALPVVQGEDGQHHEEMVTIAGEDGTLYQVASSELNGSAVLLTTGEDGQQQCLYVTDENGQPTIIQGATIDGQEMLLDQAVYNEATGTIQMFQDQSGMETQVFQQDENGQLLPVENPDEVLAQVQAAQQQEELLQQQQQQEEAELQALAQQQQQEMMQQQETQELTHEQAAEFLLQQQQQQLQQHEQQEGTLDEQQQQHTELSQEQLEAMGGVPAEGEQTGDSSEVVAQLVEASEPSVDGGPRKVVLLLSDGNLIQTEMSEEQFAALENS